MGFEIAKISGQIAAELSRLSLLPELSISFERASQECYDAFIKDRDHMRSANSDRNVVYQKQPVHELDEDCTVTLSADDQVCAMFTIEHDEDAITISHIESLPGNDLAGYVYPLALAFCHEAVKQKFGKGEITAKPPYLSTVVDEMNDRFFQFGNILAGHSRDVRAGEETPWEELLPVLMR